MALLWLRFKLFFITRLHLPVKYLHISKEAWDELSRKVLRTDAENTYSKRLEQRWPDSSECVRWLQNSRLTPRCLVTRFIRTSVDQFNQSRRKLFDTFSPRSN